MNSESALRMRWVLETPAHRPNLSSPKIQSVSSHPDSDVLVIGQCPLRVALCPVSPVKPGPPVNLQAIDFTKESVTLTWQPPTDTGRGKIFGYLLEFQMAGEVEWTKVRQLSFQTGSGRHCIQP